jgi:hypothetical protein
MNLVKDTKLVYKAIITFDYRFIAGVIFDYVRGHFKRTLRPSALKIKIEKAAANINGEVSAEAQDAAKKLLRMLRFSGE